MSQAPTPSETPITDALEEAGLLTVKFTRRLERDRARLMGLLAEVVDDQDEANWSLGTDLVERITALLKEQYGVARSTIKAIRDGRTWRDTV